MLDSAGLNRFPIWPATFARSAAHAQYSSGERTHVRLYMTASPLSPQDH